MPLKKIFVNKKYVHSLPKYLLKFNSLSYNGLNDGDVCGNSTGGGLVKGKVSRL